MNDLANYCILARFASRSGSPMPLMNCPIWLSRLMPFLAWWPRVSIDMAGGEFLAQEAARRKTQQDAARGRMVKGEK